MTEPRPFQRVGVDRVIQVFDGRALIADEMGLGKTFQAGLITKELGAYPALVVCPAGLKLQWREELWKHFRLNSKILRGFRPKGVRLAGEKLIVIANYEVIPYWAKLLLQLNFQMVIGDEIHMIRNLNSRRSRYFRRLCEGVPYVLGLTGTPMVNYPWELYPMLSTINPEDFNSSLLFGMQYCEADKPRGKWRFHGAKNLDELHTRLLNTMMIRRTKSEVIDQLPPMIRTVLSLELEDRKEYDAAERDYIGWLAKSNPQAATRAAKSQHWTKLAGLKKLAGILKLPSIIDWIERYLIESDGKLLLGTIHHRVIDALRERFKDCSVYIKGGCSESHREDAKRAFRTSPNIRIMFGQIYSMGLGVNLPEATDVALAELPWNPAMCAQFIARALRLDTKHAVNVWFLIAANTVEERVCKYIQRKQRISDQIVDGVSSRGGESLTLFSELQAYLKGKMRCP